MISDKLIEISRYYTETKRTKEELKSFCNQFDVIYSNFTNELEKECSKNLFLILDEIFMFCDSFEPNEEIRKEEPYCIDEYELQSKVLEALSKIKNK